jgi:hypothetical protein
MMRTARRLAGRHEGVGEGIVDDVHAPLLSAVSASPGLGMKLHLHIQALGFEVVLGLGVEQRRHADADQMADIDHVEPLGLRDVRRFPMRRPATAAVLFKNSRRFIAPSRKTTGDRSFRRRIRCINHASGRA